LEPFTEDLHQTSHYLQKWVKQFHLSVNQEDIFSNAIVLFPTVSNGQFTLTSTETIGSTQVEIYSISGKSVHQTKVDIQQGLRKEFNLNLNSGMYLVKFKGSSFETTKRIIIQ